MSGLIWWIIVGLLAGFITGKLMRGEGFGFFVDIIVGIVGAITEVAVNRLESANLLDRFKPRYPLLKR